MFPSSLRKRALGIGEPQAAMLGDGLLSCSRIELVEMISQLLDERKTLFKIMDEQETRRINDQEENRVETEAMVERYEDRITAFKRVADEAMVQMQFIYHVFGNLFGHCITTMIPSVLDEVVSAVEHIIVFEKIGADSPKDTKREVLIFLSKFAQKMRGVVDRHMRQGRLDLE